MLQNLNDAAPRRGNLSARRRTLFSILIFSARNAIARRRGSYFENGVEEVIEDNMKTALVCGAGGFIGSHLVKRLKKDGFWVRGVDLKFPEYSATHAGDVPVAVEKREAAAA